MAAEVRDVLRAHTVDAVNALVQILRDETTPAAARVAAARCILDHSIGRPVQAVAIANDDRPRDVEDMTTAELEAYLGARGLSSCFFVQDVIDPCSDGLDLTAQRVLAHDQGRKRP